MIYLFLLNIFQLIGMIYLVLLFTNRIPAPKIPKIKAKAREIEPDFGIQERF